MTEQSTPTRRRARSVEAFERFWAGRPEPVHGKEAYTNCIAALVEALPGLYVTVAEHASSGEFTFVRWVMHADGPFELSGIDRVRTRDGLVVENRVVFDTAEFKAKSGKDIPWA